jgi:hypothetical protein
MPASAIWGLTASGGGGGGAFPSAVQTRDKKGKESQIK